MTIDCHVDGRALTFFECEMLEDYAEQVEHGEGIALSEIIESQLEVVEAIDLYICDECDELVANCTCPLPF